MRDESELVLGIIWVSLFKVEEIVSEKVYLYDYRWGYGLLIRNWIFLRFIIK